MLLGRAPDRRGHLVRMAGNRQELFEDRALAGVQAGLALPRLAQEPLGDLGGRTSARRADAADRQHVADEGLRRPAVLPLERRHHARIAIEPRAAAGLRQRLGGRLAGARRRFSCEDARRPG